MERVLGKRVVQVEGVQGMIVLWERVQGMGFRGRWF